MSFPESVRNTKGFDKHPENINKNGRPPSIKRRLKELLAKNGEFALPEKLLLRTEVREDITYYIFKIPTETALATKVLTLAMKSNVTGLRAFQMIMEQIDGKPHQSIALENTIKSPYESMTDEQLEAERQRLLRIKNHGK